MFVLCWDEEVVIGWMICMFCMMVFEVYVWVIDDDSDDDIFVIVQVVVDDDFFVYFVQWWCFDVRIGKGDVFNVVYFQLYVFLFDDVDCFCVIVCVVDVDGEVVENILWQVVLLNVFGDFEVGVVQVIVYMKNCDDWYLVFGVGWVWNVFGCFFIWMQDIEFCGLIVVVQFLCGWMQIVGFGGNGQFIWLLVLDEIFV